ncbi:hypothetical protein DYH09_31325 [bacterium CPR1]|nr:hypothetical protein [bacterium CPR1]
MEIRSLSRQDFFAAAGELKSNRLEMAQQIEHDTRVFASVPGDTFGAMCEQADRLAGRETAVRRCWFGGQALFTVAAGAFILPNASALLNGTAATFVSSPGVGIVVGLALLGGSYYCRQRTEEQKQHEEAAIDRCGRLQQWTWLLQDAERQAAERKAQSQSSVERLAEGMKASAPGILMDDSSLRVGGVRLKRKG